MSATDEAALAKVILGNRFASASEVDELREWGRRLHPDKDLAELLFMKGKIDRPKVSLVRRMAKMARKVDEPAAPKPDEPKKLDEPKKPDEPKGPDDDPVGSEPTRIDGSSAPAPTAVDPTAQTAELVTKTGAARPKGATSRSLLKDPTTVGRYEILERVAQGGMGIVYKARHPDLGRVFAVKVLTARVQSSAEAMARFQREAKIAARLDHPNIVRVYDAGTDEGAPYLVMDYVDGPSLETVIKDEGVGVRKAAQVARSLAHALQHAHERGVVHRDVKPDNVLIPKDSGEPKITDFGIVKDLAGDEEDRKLTQTGFTLGSPCYMSPEQAAGRHAEVGPRSDVYSLAATLYQMLTGQPPFDGESIHQIMLKVVREDPRPVRKVNQAVPTDLESICMKALEKDPDRRYASAQDLADDLGRFLAEEPVLAKPAGMIVKSARFVRRHRGPVGAALLVVGLLGTGAGLAWQDARTRRREELEGRQATLALAQTWLTKAERADDPIDQRKAYYEAILQLEQVLHQDPDHPVALERKREAVLALGDHLIESGEASFAEFVFSLGVSVADPAVIGSRLEAARIGQWLGAAQEAERTNDLDEAVRLYKEGLRKLKDAGYRGEQIEQKLAELDLQLEARRVREQVVNLEALGESAARVDDHAAALLAYRRAQALAPDDRDLAAQVEHHRTKAVEEVARARAQADAARSSVQTSLAQLVADEPLKLEELMSRGDDALGRSVVAAKDEDYAAARRELEQATATFESAYGMASALHARKRVSDARLEAEQRNAQRFAPTELGRARELHDRGLAQFERGRYEDALVLFEQAISNYRLAGRTGSGKEAVAIARSEAQEIRSRAATALQAQHRLQSYRAAEEDYAQAESHYLKGEYEQARDLYLKAQERYAKVLELAPMTREAFALRVRVRNLHTECDAQRARDFARDDFEKGVKAEEAGDAALDREDPAGAVEAYSDAHYRFKRAVEGSLGPAQEVRECEQLRARIEAAQRDLTERGLTWKPHFQRAMAHLTEGNTYFQERKYSLARRRYERAVSELESLAR
jgi:tetratricopeptide (TPR) repeat protein/tRNA A-37 threonylcarbamoyl transferase component Bud32